MSAWSEYKAKLGESRPWHVVNKNIPKIDDELSKARYDICLSCDKFINLTKQCRECGCIMPVKVKLQNAQCPLEKW